MAKTNPIGVRFNTDLLEQLKKSNLADSPQKALNFYENNYKNAPQLKEAALPDNKKEKTVKDKQQKKSATESNLNDKSQLGDTELNEKDIADLAIRHQISKYQEELKTLPDKGEFATKRRKFLLKQIEQAK